MREPAHQNGRDQEAERETLYREASAGHGAAIARLAAGYEADPESRRDLIQDIHVALWRSFAGFDGRCALGTWVYRVAHNVAASHVRRHSRGRKVATTLDLDAVDDRPGPERRVGARLDLDRLLGLIRRLRPPDRQIMLLYLEDMDAAAIGDIVGLSAGAVSTRLHRIRKTLTRRMADAANDGGDDDGQ
ncbi:sigma-70 family RNA polymerase sigma factor [Fodinicurvata sp. EGI_FJ10296]|uniref:RNA polymerase sigma factor n=1 Tax=Fodinicurvata sp. EGI_FJ10296 TaxID=3231908 RepID=UPI0034528A6F